jgi:hypothetical protein
VLLHHDLHGLADLGQVLHRGLVDGDEALPYKGGEGRGGEEALHAQVRVPYKGGEGRGGEEALHARVRVEGVRRFV